MTTNVTTTIEHRVDIAASPATVYMLWTTPHGLRAWWGVDAEVDARVGGEIRVDVDGEHVMLGEFTRLDEPEFVEFTFGWIDGEVGPGSTTVAVSIESTDGGCSVVLRHEGLPTGFVERHVEGWTHFLGDRLTAEGASEAARAR